VEQSEYIDRNGIGKRYCGKMNRKEQVLVRLAYSTMGGYGPDLKHDEQGSSAVQIV